MSVLDQERTNRLAAIRAGIGRRLKAFHEHELYSPMPDRIGHLLSELKCVSKKGTGDSPPSPASPRRCRSSPSSKRPMTSARPV